MDCIVHGVRESRTRLSNFHREAWRAAVQWVVKSWTLPSDRTTTAIYEVDFCTRKIPEHGNKNILQSLNFKHKVLLRKKKCAEIKISESTLIL